MIQQFFKVPSLASAYAKLRPQPPASLIAQVVAYVQEGHLEPLEAAVDVGCGSGQSTQVLTPYFASVIGLDISPAQIAEARKMITNPSVTFKVCGAEHFLVPDGSQQLVTVGTACHWFDMPKFFQEVDRVLVPGGVVAIYCYQFPQVCQPYPERLSECLNEVYTKLLDYWGENINHVVNAYHDPKFAIPYPGMIRDETHQMEVKWTVAEVVKFVTSWSSFHNFKDKHGEAAAQEILDTLKERLMTTLGVPTAPEDAQLILHFQYYLLMARKPRT